MPRDVLLLLLLPVGDYCSADDFNGLRLDNNSTLIYSQYRTLVGNNYDDWYSEVD